MASSMQEYLKRYTGGIDEAGREVSKKKKRKKKRKKKGPGDAVRIVDDDAVWQKEIKDESEEEDEDDAPEVSMDIESRRIQRMEAIKAQRPYYSRSDDGSGWVAINEPAEIGPFAEDSSPPNKSNINGMETRCDSQDLSPPRKSLHDTPDSTPPRKSRHDTANLSPRRRSQHDTPELSPPRKSQHDTHDLSPPRKSRHDISGQPPLRETCHDTADLSPPRKSQHESPDSSPPRKSRHESSNLSPPRKSQDDTPDLSPPRKSRHDTPDLSPPRKTRHNTSCLSSPKKTLDRSQGSSLGKQAQQATPDLSPLRKHGRYHSPDRKSYPSRNLRHDTPDLRTQEVHIDIPESVPLRQAQQVAPDLSPPRKLRTNASPPRKPRHESPNLCPRRKGHGNTPDLSLSRNSSIHTPDLSPSRKQRFERDAERDEMLQNRDQSHRKDEIYPSLKARGRDMMMDGSSTGLCSGKDVVEGLSKKKEEDVKRISEMDPSMTGRGADTVYRDKHGRRLESLELLKLQQADKKPKEKPLEWGKGLVQQREMEAIATAIEAEKDKPFARTRDDPELDKSLKERVRWGDPMAHLIKRKITEPILEDFGKSEKLKESGFIVPQNIPNHSWLKRGITAPPNRYGIKPGRHWDGVDRSNGFEKQLFKQQNEKLALQQEAYLWSVSEM